MTEMQATHLLSIAPMIDWSDTYFRGLMRLLAPNALLYTEMQMPEAVFNQPEKSLQFEKIESPIALQLGGRDPIKLKKAAIIAEDKGFNEINLNLGCPSSRVLSGQFGACLMHEASLVGECIEAMKHAVSIPVTAKTRIGVDNHDSYDFFKSFIDTLISAGADKLVIHARKAWLKGLSPKQNRTIPPIQYDFVYRLKTERPSIPIVINGEINCLEGVEKHLKAVDGVMIGRLACDNPYAISELHNGLYPNLKQPTRASVLSDYFDLISKLNPPTRVRHRILKPILNLSHGLKGTRAFKQSLLKVYDFQDIPALNNLRQTLSEMEE